jgi:PHD/YefM family antitoxin component YafN of YafNO toxin-antitoxin module
VIKNLVRGARVTIGMTIDTAGACKASEFKAKCLKLMDEVAQSGEPLVVTKNGRLS